MLSVKNYICEGRGGSKFLKIKEVVIRQKKSIICGGKKSFCLLLCLKVNKQTYFTFCTSSEEKTNTLTLFSFSSCGQKWKSAFSNKQHKEKSTTVISSK